jgi:hypothetical protein
MPWFIRSSSAEHDLRQSICFTRSPGNIQLHYAAIYGNTLYLRKTSAHSAYIKDVVKLYNLVSCRGLCAPCFERTADEIADVFSGCRIVTLRILFVLAGRPGARLKGMQLYKMPKIVTVPSNPARQNSSLGISDAYVA